MRRSSKAAPQMPEMSAARQLKLRSCELVGTHGLTYKDLKLRFTIQARMALTELCSSAPSIMVHFVRDLEALQATR